MESITILRPVLLEPLVPDPDLTPDESLLLGELDALGEPVHASDEEIVSEGWAVAPLSADEDSLATGQAVVAGYNLFKRDALVDIRPTDRVIVRGEVWAVTSPTNHWQNPRSPRMGTVVTVRRSA